MNIVKPELIQFRVRIRVVRISEGLLYTYSVPAAKLSGSGNNCPI